MCKVAPELFIHLGDNFKLEREKRGGQYYIIVDVNVKARGKMILTTSRMSNEGENYGIEYRMEIQRTIISLRANFYIHQSWANGEGYMGSLTNRGE